MSKPKIRCAIYTRKSSDDGLDQDFNSLDAQYEACAAFVASQRHEGWVLDKARYDDGGISGGTLERPAMQQLLGDIDDGRIQMVVVYKIDRLTRSLADFAKLVDRFDATNCSFVSVTQAFNTASSMGRLTLNVLLSFAQFEREVTAERIRDKIAASKMKGLWMGGIPPLGYDPHPDPKVRGLVVNKHEATVVKQIYEFYCQQGCLSAVVKSAERAGLRSKQHHFKSGRTQGGNLFSRGQVYAILRNPIYVGKIRHKEKIWEGQHDAIIDDPQWEHIQALLQNASARPRTKAAKPHSTTKGAMLTGKLRDETGDRLTPTHTQRHGRRIGYYVSNRLISGGVDPTGWRLPAAELEQAVAAAIATHIKEHARSHRISELPDLLKSEAIAAKAQSLVRQLCRSHSDLIRVLLVSGKISKGAMSLYLNKDGLAAELEVLAVEIDPSVLHVETSFQLRRRGVEGKIVVGDLAPSEDRTLVRALAMAHAAVAEMRTGKSLSQIAAQSKCSVGFIQRRAGLAFLAPRIQTAILEGRQPFELTLEKIIRSPVPLEWDQQAELYGFENGRYASATS